MSGVLNPKVTKENNKCFVLKCQAWTRRAKERKLIKKRTFDQGKKIRADFEGMLQEFPQERQVLQRCLTDYHNLVEDLQTTRKQEKVSNDFLAQLSQQATLELHHLEKLLNDNQAQFSAEFKVLERFAGWVKSDCALEKFYFNFHYIPELILKKQVTKKDYEVLTKLLLKVKQQYLNMKSKQQPDKRQDELSITDEDMVPLELFDVALGQIKHKFEDKR